MLRTRRRGQGLEPSPTRNWPEYKDRKLLLSLCASTWSNVTSLVHSTLLETWDFLFVCLFVLVYSLQEETTYCHYALRILHLNGNLGEIACFESIP